MSLAKLSQQPGQVGNIIQDCHYIADPLTLYQQLCAGQSHTLLLESAEIESKNSVNSLILASSALKLVCNGDTVTATALSKNGLPLISFLHTELQSHANATGEGTVQFQFKRSDDLLDEDARLKSTSVFDVLRCLQSKLQALSDHPHAIFIGGTFAYDLLATYEQLPEVGEGDNTCPDYVLYVADLLVLVDHQKQFCQLVGSVFSGPDVAQSYFDISQKVESLGQQIAASTQQGTASAPAKAATANNTAVSVNKSDGDFCQEVEQLKHKILAGDIFQVVPSRTFSLDCADPYAAYQQLKLHNPSPYMFYIQDEDFVIFGASPESALKYQSHNNQVEVYPIAGTRPRGKRPNGNIDPDLDSRIELTLREDNKEKAEHLMLVDLARNDIARVAQPGTRYVRDLLKVDRYSHVMHLVSRVVGQLRADLDCLHAYQACMNMGTLVGAPKVRAAELIREVEQARRGSYGGAVGYINGHGDMDTCIVIRSAFVKDGTAHVQAGAGVVYDSVPQSEADETRSKAQAVIHAIQLANAVNKEG